MHLSASKRADLERLVSELWNDAVTEGHGLFSSTVRAEHVEKLIEWATPQSFSARVRRGTEEESNLDDPEFFGDGYDKAQDQRRLTGQMLQLFNAMLDGKWHIRIELSEETGISLLSIRSRLSDLRQQRWGGHQIDSERLAGGVWRDRMRPNTESLAYRELRALAAA